MDRGDDRIDRFLHGEMSGEELTAFHDEMRSNPMLKSEIDTRRDLIAVLKASEQVALKDELKSSIQKKEANRLVAIRKMRRLRIVSAVAASLVVFLLAMLWLRPTSLADLARTYAEEYYPPPSIARDNGASSPRWDHFIRLYSESRYGQASEIYSNEAKENLKVEELFYLGLCHTYATPPNNTVAIDLLSSVNTISAYYDPAQWYLALCLIQTDQADQAREVLEEIVKEQKWKWQDAGELLSRF